MHRLRVVDLCWVRAVVMHGAAVAALWRGEAPQAAGVALEAAGHGAGRPLLVLLLLVLLLLLGMVVVVLVMMSMLLMVPAAALRAAVPGRRSGVAA